MANILPDTKVEDSINRYIQPNCGSYNRYYSAWTVFEFWVNVDSVEFRCYEVKIKKAGSHWESNPGHLWLEPPMLCHWATTAGQPPTFTILYIYCTGGIECLSCTPGSHSACAVRTLLGVDLKIRTLFQERTYAEWFLNAESILLQAKFRWYEVAEHWRLKPLDGMRWQSTGGCRPFILCPYFTIWGHAFLLLLVVVVIAC